MRTHCLVCGAPLMTQTLLECPNMPTSAQHFPDEYELKEDQPINLTLWQCSGCGLVQLDSEPVAYYRDVIRSGGYSTTMRNLRREQYARLMQLCPLEGKRIIEIGCGQGEFLRVWREMGFHVQSFGIEHNPKLVEAARKDGLEVSVGFAEDEDTVIPGALFDAFTSFNFLEHQPNPNGMLRCIYNNLADDAWGIITVPSLEYILEKESFYELIYDHIAYYSEDTLRFVLNRNGFDVIASQVLNRDTWEMIVRKRKRVNSEKLRQNQALLKTEVQRKIRKLEEQGKRLAVWGASHQGLTILSSMDLGQKVQYVIDSAPFKQGKYTIGSHVKIVPFSYFNEAPVDVILIVAPGYTEEIASIIRKACGSAVEIWTLRGNALEVISTEQ